MNVPRSNSPNSRPEPVSQAVSDRLNFSGNFPFALWQKALLFCVAYFLCAEASVLLTVRNALTTSFWLPAGLYVAILLMSETRTWPWLVLAVFPANFAFDLLYGTKPIIIFFFYAANTVQSVAGAWLVRRFVAERPTMATLGEFLGLLGFSVFSTLLGATIGAATLCVSGLSPSFLESFKSWWGSCAMAILLLTPVLLSWLAPADPKHPRSNSPGRFVEAGFLMAVTCLVIWYLMFCGQGVMSPNKSLFLLPVLWASLRFGPRGTSAVILFLAVAVAFLTTHFFKGLTPEQIASGEYVFVMQTFLASGSVVGLLPAITLCERDHTLAILRENEERFRNFAEAAFEGICILENGRILDMNGPGLKMFGYNRDEVIGKEAVELVAPESRAKVVDVMLNGQESLYEVRVLRKDGSFFFAEAQAKIIREANRTLRLGAFRDVTERKRSEESLRASEERYRSLVNTQKDVVFLVNADGTFASLNPAFEQITGWPVQEWLGKSFPEHIHPEDLPRALSALQTILSGKPVDTLELRVTRASGGYLCMELTVAPQWSGGKVVGSLGIARDVTARKQAERELQWRTAFFEAQVHSSVDGILVVDSHFKKIIQNQRMTDLWKIPESIANDIDDTKQIQFVISQVKNPRIFGERIAYLYAHPDETSVDEFELINGTILDRYSAPVRGNDGTYFGRVWIFRDITKEKSSQAELVRHREHLEQLVAERTQELESARVAALSLMQDAQRQQHKLAEALEAQRVLTDKLGAANSELESFSYSVSHDLRAPLRRVRLYAKMMSDATEGQLSAKPVHYLKTIAEASVEMGELIDDLLAFSRMGRTEMRESIVDLNALVKVTIKGLELETVSRNINWKIASLPPAVGDPAMLKQVLSNLIGNAVKYSRQRDPAEIEIGCAGEENGRRIFFVRDNGAGFNMQAVHKLFGVFQRLHRADEFEGTGIGLAIVRRILTRHGERIWAEGELGKGAVFFFTLKLGPTV